MKKQFIPVALLSLMTLLSGCAVAGGIFKTGVWVGVIIVVGIIALIIFLVSKGGK